MPCPCECAPSADREGRYLLFNEAAEKISGKRAEEVLGRDDTCLFPPDEARHVMNEDLSVVTSGTTVSFEETLITSSGEHKCFLTTKGSFRDEQGTIKGIFGISRDITERKLIEKVLEEELPGYREYEQRTRRRMIPGIW